MSDSDESDDGLGADTVVLTPVRRRGRPRKHVVVPQPQQQQQQIVVPGVPPSSNVSAAAILRAIQVVPRNVCGVGLVVDVLRFAAETPLGEHVLVNHVFGDLPLPAIVIEAEARMLGEDPRTLKRSVLQTGAFLHSGTLAVYSGCIKRLLSLVAAGSLELVAVLEWATFDETPMVFRQAAQSDLSAPHQAVTGKILQTDYMVGILVSVPVAAGLPQRFELLNMPVPLPLQNLDRCTGVNMMQALGYSLVIPDLSELRVCLRW